MIIGCMTLKELQTILFSGSGIFHILNKPKERPPGMDVVILAACGYAAVWGLTGYRRSHGTV